MSVEPVDCTESICFHGMLEQNANAKVCERTFFSEFNLILIPTLFSTGRYNNVHITPSPTQNLNFICSENFSEFESESGCIKTHQRVRKTAKNSKLNSATRTKQTAEIHLHDFGWTVLDFREFSALEKIRQTAKLFAFILSRSTVTDGIMETAC